MLPLLPSILKSKGIIRWAYHKKRNREEEKGVELISGADLQAHQFLENGAIFESHIIEAAKTGFFLDQRDNRLLIKEVSQGKSVLNLFGYTGGFSIFAGLGGATKVTTIDIAPKAIEASERNWKLNQLPAIHQGVVADVFVWLKEQTSRERYDIVITDPPSFAPNEKARAHAREAYIEVFSDSIRLVKAHGLFAASSCSGHISFEEFLDIVKEAVSKARRRGQVVALRGQPEDHTWPLALEEMRYLKFALIQLD
jgi:23S rRNA (cytosine1962-C5)-methyltransferase